MLHSFVVLQSKPLVPRDKYVQCSKAQTIQIIFALSNIVLGQLIILHFILYVGVNIHSQLVSSRYRTLGLVFQSENFNYNRYPNYIMDSWPYLENPVPEQNNSKSRLHPTDDLAALTMLYEQCKVAHTKSPK